MKLGSKRRGTTHPQSTGSRRYSSHEPTYSHNRFSDPEPKKSRVYEARGQPGDPGAPPGATSLVGGAGSYAKYFALFCIVVVLALWITVKLQSTDDMDISDEQTVPDNSKTLDPVNLPDVNKQDPNKDLMYDDTYPDDIEDDGDGETAADTEKPETIGEDDTTSDEDNDSLGLTDNDKQETLKPTEEETKSATTVAEEQNEGDPKSEKPTEKETKSATTAAEEQNKGDPESAKPTDRADVTAAVTTVKSEEETPKPTDAKKEDGKKEKSESTAVSNEKDDNKSVTKVDDENVTKEQAVDTEKLTGENTAAEISKDVDVDTEKLTGESTVAEISKDVDVDDTKKPDESATEEKSKDVNVDPEKLGGENTAEIPKDNDVGDTKKPGESATAEKSKDVDVGDTKKVDSESSDIPTNSIDGENTSINNDKEVTDKKLEGEETKENKDTTKESTKPEEKIPDNKGSKETTKNEENAGNGGNSNEDKPNTTDNEKNDSKRRRTEPEPGHAEAYSFKKMDTTENARDFLRILTWNIEKGYQDRLSKIISTLSKLSPDILLLTGVDWDCERTTTRKSELSGDIASILAVSLRLQHRTFQTSFVELWSKEREANMQGGGVHGNVILSRYPVADVRSGIYKETPKVWTKDNQQPRKGGRGFLGQTIDTPFGNITVVVTQLEKYATKDQRVLQFKELSRHFGNDTAPTKIHEHTKGYPIIIGGDFNTWSYNINEDDKKKSEVVEALRWKKDIIPNMPGMSLEDPFPATAATSYAEYKNTDADKVDWLLIDKRFEVTYQMLAEEDEVFTDNFENRLSDHLWMYVDVSKS